MKSFFNRSVWMGPRRRGPFGATSFRISIAAALFTKHTIRQAYQTRGPLNFEVVKGLGFN